MLVDLEAALLAAPPRAEAVIAAVRRDLRKLGELGRAWWRGGKEWSRFLEESLAGYPGEHLPIREDVLACLKDLQRNGKKIFFLTHLPPAWVRAFLTQHGLAGEILALEGDRQASRSHKLAAAQQWCAAQAAATPQIWDCPDRTAEPSLRRVIAEHNILFFPSDAPPVHGVLGCGQRWRHCGRINGSRMFLFLYRCLWGISGGRRHVLGQPGWRWWRLARQPRACMC